MTTIDDLNKTQFILLVLLICFVTSIATGIITATLLAEAPVSVTQTINRVVERTIETVAPDSLTAKYVLSADDKQLLEAVNRAISVSVEIREKGAATSTPSILGIIVSEDGLIVASTKGITSSSTYMAILPSNSTVELELVRAEEKNNTAVFRIKESENVPTDQ